MSCAHRNSASNEKGACRNNQVASNHTSTSGLDVLLDEWVPTN